MQRRSFLKGFGTAIAVSSMVPVMSLAKEDAGSPKGPNAMSLAAAVEAITNAKGHTPSKQIELKAPEIAENGAVVPVKIDVQSPMTQNDHVKAIHVLASKNGNVRCANVFLSPDNGKAHFSTRIKLGGTQDVVAIAELSNGSFISTKQSIKVTIGGCG